MAMTTAATLMSPAPVYTDWKRVFISIANNVTYHGTRLSIPRPMKGANATPVIPTKPKRPITSLEYTVNQHRNQQQPKNTLRGVMIRRTTKKEGQGDPEITEGGRYRQIDEASLY